MTMPAIDAARIKIANIQLQSCSAGMRRQIARMATIRKNGRVDRGLLSEATDTPVSLGQAWTPPHEHADWQRQN